jgi:hypothetical protein
MSRITIGASPVALDEVRRQFEKWRQSRVKLEPIPADLWQLAVSAARHHGIYPVSRELHVEYSRLKREVGGPTPSARCNRSPASGFVEVRVPAPVVTPECVVEMERPDGGRMRVRVSAPEHLAALSRSFWGCLA